ncbi:hypothetical protein BDW22DRAFT_1361846 [Trametopsis cervina]|nr:hypothetical protein BDW22DRAFT_1361846 [Trametopsis cervina]
MFYYGQTALFTNTAARHSCPLNYRTEHPYLNHMRHRSRHLTRTLRHCQVISRLIWVTNKITVMRLTSTAHLTLTGTTTTLVIILIPRSYISHSDTLHGY